MREVPKLPEVVEVLSEFLLEYGPPLISREVCPVFVDARFEKPIGGAAGGSGPVRGVAL